jgi:hypothetical protein
VLGLLGRRFVDPRNDFFHFLEFAALIAVSLLRHTPNLFLYRVLAVIRVRVRRQKL